MKKELNYYLENKRIKLFIFGILVFITPIVFVGLIKLYYVIVPGEEIGEKGDWISFAGGYVGALLALGGIWWETNHKKREKEKKENEEYDNFLSYFKELMSFNLIELKRKELELKQVRVYHKLFLKAEDILTIKKPPKVVLDSFIKEVVQKKHYKILELLATIDKIEEIIMVTHKNCELKVALLERINKLVTEKEKEINQKKSELSDFDRTEVSELNCLEEQEMILNNFLASSAKCITPSGNFQFVFNSKDGNTTRFLFENNSLNKRYTFKRYGIQGKILPKQFTPENYYQMFEEFYKELYNVLCYDGYTIKRNDEYKELAVNIGKFLAFDDARDELLMQYKKELESTLEM